MHVQHSFRPEGVLGDQRLESREGRGGAGGAEPPQEQLHVIDHRLQAAVVELDLGEGEVGEAGAEERVLHQRGAQRGELRARGRVKSLGFLLDGGDQGGGGEVLEGTARRQPLGPHILTGPVHIDGAAPGDVLEVRIHEVSVIQDWGFNLILPLLGTLPHDYDEPRCVNIPIDVERNVATMPWGPELEIKPFFGVMGVAPPKGWGRVTSVAPQAFAGNLDNKELGAGATLFLPVFVEGALFSCGDGHGAQATARSASPRSKRPCAASSSSSCARI